jgi:hypothetical protein
MCTGRDSSFLPRNFGRNYPAMAANRAWRLLIEVFAVEEGRFHWLQAYKNTAREPEAAASPLTPVDVQVLTPPPYPLFRSVFLELPTLSFLRSAMPAFGKIALRTTLEEQCANHFIH